MNNSRKGLLARNLEHIALQRGLRDVGTKRDEDNSEIRVACLPPEITMNCLDWIAVIRNHQYENSHVLHTLKNRKPIIVCLTPVECPLGMLFQELLHGRPQPTANLVYWNPRRATLFLGIPTTTNGFTLPFIYRCVMKNDVLLDHGVPTGQLTLQMTLDMPRVNKKEICLHEGTCKVTLVNKGSLNSLHHTFLQEGVHVRRPKGVDQCQLRIRTPRQRGSKRLRTDDRSDTALHNGLAF